MGAASTVRPQFLYFYPDWNQIKVCPDEGLIEWLTAICRSFASIVITKSCFLAVSLQFGRTVCPWMVVWIVSIGIVLKKTKKTLFDATFHNIYRSCVLSFQSVSSPLQSLQQRTWLIHWSLFVFFNHPKGRDNIIELFLYQPQWVSLFSNSGHLFRYKTCHLTVVMSFLSTWMYFWFKMRCCVYRLF